MGRFDVVEHDVLSGRALLWLAVVDGEIKAALVTQIHEAQTWRACEILAIGGDGMKQWFHLLPMIEQYAKMNGCKKVYFTGRIGWERVMETYTVAQVVMERQL